MRFDATSQQPRVGWLAQLDEWRKRLLGRGRGERRAQATALYASAVQQARRAAFYQDLGVPDTDDARLELVQLHVILLLRRLQRGGPDGQALGQALFDVFFRDLDRSLREAGVGDLSVGKWVKKLAQQFYARATNLEAALGQDDAAAVAEIVRGNVTGSEATDDQVGQIAAYALAADAALAAAAAGDTPLEALSFDGIDPIGEGRRCDASLAHGHP